MKAATPIIALACLFAPTADADVVIEFKNQGKQSQFLSNGKMARINTRGTDDYMIVNFDQNAIYSVISGQNQVNNLSDSLPAIGGSSPPQIKLRLRPLGKGPAIAGYPTTRYRMSANGEYCGSVYASKEALKGSAIEEMFDTLKAMADSHMQSLGGFAALIPDCQLAQMKLTDKLQEVGAPMRMTNKDGEIDSEITKILKKASVEAEYYALPTHYQLAATDKEITNADKQRQADNTQKHRSEKQRSARAVSPRSRIPPEAKIQMWRYREMMRYR
jgi:hypothetical protein